MNGVEILASNEVVIETCFNFPYFLIILGIIFAIGIVVGLFCGFVDCDFGEGLKFGAILGLFFGIFSGIFAGFGEAFPIVYETQYKVTISDEVQMNSFLERFEILDQEGKIYTIREK